MKPTLCDPPDCSLPGSSIPGIFQARVLEWVAMPSSRGSSQSKGRTRVSHVAGTLYYLSHQACPSANPQEGQAAPSARGTECTAALQDPLTRGCALPGTPHMNTAPIQLLGLGLCATSGLPGRLSLTPRQAEQSSREHRQTAAEARERMVDAWMSVGWAVWPVAQEKAQRGSNFPRAHRATRAGLGAEAQLQAATSRL